MNSRGVSSIGNKQCKKTFDRMTDFSKMSNAHLSDVKFCNSNLLCVNHQFKIDIVFEIHSCYSNYFMIKITLNCIFELTNDKHINFTQKLNYEIM